MVGSQTFHHENKVLAASTLFSAMTLAELLGRKMCRKDALLSIGERLLQITLTGIILGYVGSIVFSYKYLARAIM